MGEGRMTQEERAQQNRVKMRRALDLLERAMIKQLASGVRGACGVRVPINGDRIGDPRLVMETDDI